MRRLAVRLDRRAWSPAGARRGPSTAPGRRTWPPSPRRASRSRAGRPRRRPRPRSACAPAAACSLSIARAVGGRVARGDVGRLEVVGLGDVADPDHLRARRPARRRWAASLSSASAVALGQLVALGEQHGRAQRRRRRAARPRCPPASRPGRRARRPPAGCPPSARGRPPGRRPAASATGSAPPTRVVFLVAKTGKPSAGPAGSSSPVWPSTGVPCSACSCGEGLSFEPPPPPPQPASRRQSRTRAAGARRIGHDKLAARGPRAPIQVGFITCRSGVGTAARIGE